jgi:hypothetical protein
MKIVCIGDFHIPDRMEKIPSWIKNKIQEEKPEKMVSPGDFTSEKVLKQVEKLSDAELIAVQGNMDWVDLPKHETLELDGLTLGVLHGSGIVPRGDLSQLGVLAKRMKAQILVHGHTHKLSVDEKNGVLFVNPGSATGSYGGASDRGPESFIILEVQGKKVDVRKIVDGEESVETHEL